MDLPTLPDPRAAGGVGSVAAFDGDRGAPWVPQPETARIATTATTGTATATALAKLCCGDTGRTGGVPRQGEQIMRWALSTRNVRGAKDDAARS